MVSTNNQQKDKYQMFLIQKKMMVIQKHNDYLYYINLTKYTISLVNKNLMKFEHNFYYNITNVEKKIQ